MVHGLAIINRQGLFLGTMDQLHLTVDSVRDEAMATTDEISILDISII